MRRALIFIIFFTCCFSSGIAFKDLSGTWYMSRSDEDWSSTKIEEKGGETVKIPSYINLLKSSGYLWLQTSFKLNPQLTEDYNLVIGGIQDVEEVFLNGVKIGQTGEFPPDYTPAPPQTRIYSIPDSLLFGENLLSLRIYSEKTRGGIVKNPVGIFTKEELEKELIVTAIPHRSISSVPFSNGYATAEYDFSKRAVTAMIPHVYAHPSAGSETPQLIKEISLQLTSPDSLIPLKTLRSLSEGYIPATGIVHQRLEHDEFILNIYTFSPFRSDKPMTVICATLEGKNVLPYIPSIRIDYPSPNLAWREEFYRVYKEKSYLTAVIGYSEEGRSSAQRFVNRFLNENPHLLSLERELDWWQKWHSETIFPDNITSTQEKIYKQSLTLLKMAQSREDYPASGQIVSSLSPFADNITLVRDCCYAIDALVKSGHYEEARNAIQFLLNGKTGNYKDFTYKGEEVGIGMPYLISVQGYYGNGQEYADTTWGSPRISLDGFGLFLSAVRGFVDKTEDMEFLRYYWDVISGKIAEPLLNQITKDDLIRKDSGPGYDPLPGRIYTYTSACAAKGLMDASWLAYRLNDQVNAQRYEQAAFRLNQGILSTLVDPYEITLKDYAVVNNPAQYMGLFSVEALNWVVPLQNPYYEGTINAYNKYLKMKYTGKGYSYSLYRPVIGERECVPMEIRLVNAFRKGGHNKEAENILDWVSQQALWNYSLIPEYYTPYISDYGGKIPSVGLGAGAYIISFWK